jgi:Heterokaryon incompatibility protein (HET)
MDLASGVRSTAVGLMPQSWRIYLLPGFKYNRLGSDQIRLLTLLPGSASAPICCVFKTTSRTESGTDFSALSYCWGPKTWMSRTIVLDGCVIPVQPNLYHALVALRSPDEPRDLWIDAVCINQADADEKSEQLRHMSRIYSSASRVVVWLGSPRDDSEFVMDCIHNRREDDFVTKRFILGIVALLERPWFTRTWIVQEYALSRRPPFVACGLHSVVPWEDFMRAHSASTQYSQLKCSRHV